MGAAASKQRENIIHQSVPEPNVPEPNVSQPNTIEITDEILETDKVLSTTDVPEVPPRYPPVFAPTSTKKDVFHPERLKEAPERARSVPHSALGDYSSLLKHLLNNAKSDLEKVWSIYLWIINQDFTDPAIVKYSAGDTPKGYLKLISNGRGDIATFFAILCRRANIKCAIIDGISKAGDYEVGMSEQELEKMRDRWNAVYLDKNWRFVHPSWGNKASQNIKSYFFLTEPEEFNTWCRPDDRQWQLLTTMVTMSEFAMFPYFTAEFFMMNMKVLSPKVGKVRARNGHVFVEIATTRNVGKTVVVRYSLLGKRLLKPRQHMNGNAGESTQRGIITSRLHEIEEEGEDKVEELHTPTAFPTDLENYVFMWRKDAHIMFDIQLPVSGSYIFSVEAGHMNADYSVLNTVVIAELKLFCFDNVTEDDINLFPDVPEIGWGVTPHCLVRGIRPISHVDGEVFVLPDADTTIRFELDHDYEFDIEMISANFSEDLSQYESHSVHNNMLTIKVRIPGEGKYGLKIFAKGNDDVDFVNVCNYFLVFNKVSSNVEKFPKRMIRQKLEREIEKGTIHTLKEAMDDFVLHNVPDRGEVKKAKDKIGFFDDKKALSDAIKRKNPAYLQKAIQDAKKSRFTAELEDDIKRAEIALAKLNRMEGYLHPIAKLENSTLAEIRSYTWPTDVVRNVLSATYVLLGEDYEYLQDWDYIQALMARVGKDGLKSKVLHLDTESVPMNQVDLADIIIDPHKLDEAREASTGTAALYQWIKHIVTEKKSQQTSANSSVMSDNMNSKTKFKVKYPQKPVGGQSDKTNSGKQEKSKSGQSMKGNKGPSGRNSLKNNGTNSKQKEYDELKHVRDTNISSQHRFPKSENDNGNIIGLKIIHESRSPNSKKSPTSKNSTPTQKSQSSKNNTPTQKLASSKNASPSQRSPAGKYISPTQKITPNRSPNQKSPSQKSQKSPVENPPMQRFHVIKSPQRTSPKTVPADAPPHRSPIQRRSDEYLSPVALSPVSPTDRHSFKNFSLDSPNEK